MAKPIPLDMPTRDPSEHLRFAIYEYDKIGIPQLVAEFDEIIERWYCRFCEIKHPDMFRMRDHVGREHMND